MPLDMTETAPLVSDSRAIGGAERARSFVFARTGVEAEARLAEALEKGSVGPGAAALWIAVKRRLPPHRQELDRAQHEISLEAGLSRPTARKAWEDLARLGLVCGPRRVGAATYWQVSADAATRLPEKERVAVLQAQQKAAPPRAAA